MQDAFVEFLVCNFGALIKSISNNDFLIGAPAIINKTLKIKIQLINGQYYQNFYCGLFRIKDNTF